VRSLRRSARRQATGTRPRCRNLPGRPGPRVDPRSDDDPGPIPGESFDDVTAAWIAGRLSDRVYQAAIRAAGGS
jgi:hypothetical protein